MAQGLIDEASRGSHSDELSTDEGTLEPLCHILTPIGMLGYGFDESLIYKALQDLATNETPTALILDSGSTDGGPLKLATGSMTAPRVAYIRDLRKLLALSHEFKVPVIISSAGGDGTNEHVDEVLAIVQEIIEEEPKTNYKFKAVGIYSGVTKVKVLKALAADEVTGCGVSVPALTTQDVEDATVVVAQMGPEPFMDVMGAETYDIIIGGRAYDPSPYIAFCADLATKKFGLPFESLKPTQLGGFAFMGKIMECGALCSIPKSASSKATIYCDGTFDIVPLSPNSYCSPVSVAAHTLYEKTRPDILPGPGGSLHLDASKYEQLADGRSVRVTGAIFKLSRQNRLPYTVKLEAAKIIGYRTLLMGGFRDPILIKGIDSFLERAKAYVKQQHKESPGTWELDWHVYGVDGIMGSLEPGDPSYQPREVFLVGEALASSQELATSVASCARIACVHGPYPGQRGTGGNFAMGVGGKLEVEMGPCAEFCIYHLMPLEIGAEHAQEIRGVDTASTDGGHTPIFSWRRMVMSSCAKTPTYGPLATQIPEAIAMSDFNGVRDVQKAPKLPPCYLNLADPRTLCDVASVVRSKNSGPYEITLDVLFSQKRIYNLMQTSNILTPSAIAKLYKLREDEIIYCGFYDQAMAFKATIPRKRLGKAISGGSFMEADVHGSQQYAGLLGLDLSQEVRRVILGWS
ncbi:hypothetical protein GLAREA_06582 [Glarea lozoyensis ATCC 20868]|uniref:Uncharacterized protein n=1 Tax=Glarea lozoyensis (strain ATCC 20868 / MF5171) TaxID=1116229 RepID=S3D8U8_GLAL2|nr:uncharacterized protein GLAREA_06582 [Glarea lozoyensis ATCC 20868]EPE33569.1 hypothetical protein GLAREA_06582 [Glarea lozoyensis ATCC 20868]